MLPICVGTAVVAQREAFVGQQPAEGASEDPAMPALVRQGYTVAQAAKVTGWAASVITAQLSSNPGLSRQPLISEVGI